MAESCCSLALPGDRLLWQGEFCYSLALLEDKLLWHGAFCYRLVLLGGRMLGARSSTREVPKGGRKAISGEGRRERVS